MRLIFMALIPMAALAGCGREPEVNAATPEAEFQTSGLENLSVSRPPPELTPTPDKGGVVDPVRPDPGDSVVLPPATRPAPAGPPVSRPQQPADRQPPPPIPVREPPPPPPLPDPHAGHPAANVTR